MTTGLLKCPIVLTKTNIDYIMTKNRNHYIGEELPNEYLRESTKLHWTSVSWKRKTFHNHGYPAEVLERLNSNPARRSQSKASKARI